MCGGRAANKDGRYGYEFIFSISVMPSHSFSNIIYVVEKWERGAPPLNPLWEHCYDEKMGVDCVLPL